MGHVAAASDAGRHLTGLLLAEAGSKVHEIIQETDLGRNGCPPDMGSTVESTDEASIGHISSDNEEQLASVNGTCSTSCSNAAHADPVAHCEPSFPEADAVSIKLQHHASVGNVDAVASWLLTNQRGAG